MLLQLLLILAGIAILYGGAELLVKGSVSLAQRLNLTPLVIGLTVVAFGTGMPEMVVSIGAALSDAGAIAAGNVVGSNIANIALILGLSALVSPLVVNVRIVRLDIPVMVLVSILLIVLLIDNRIGRIEGAMLFSGLIAYTLFSVISARKEDAVAQHTFDDVLPKKTLSVPVSTAFVIAALFLLVAGAQALVTGAVSVAEHFGLSDAVIGLTIVAVGTSLPELATSVVAVFKKEGDLAIGNIVGSNIFNILGILGVASLVRPLNNTGMSLIDLGVMLAFALLLLPLARSGWRLSRWEGAVFLVIYVAYTVFLLNS